MESKIDSSMRLNPTYYAAQELCKEKKELFSFPPKFLTNRWDSLYCLIPLPQDNSQLSLDGTEYLTKGKPHLSIFQYYEKKETRFSVFHFTWYGLSLDKENARSTVLHVYLDRVGRYLYCQANEGMHSITISLKEQLAIQKYVQEKVGLLLDSILLHVAGRFTTAENLISEHLGNLDKLSLKKSQFPKYKQTAEKCFRAMEDKYLWSFGPIDPRLNLLKEMVAAVEENSINTENLNAHGFYASKKSQNKQQAKKETRPGPSKTATIKKSNLTNGVISAQVNEELDFLNSKISDYNNNQEISLVEKTLKTLDLLIQKSTILTRTNTMPLIENELVKVLQQINSHYKTIENLFEEEATKGNIDLVKTLRPFIFTFDVALLAKLLDIGNVEICQYLVQEFDTAIFYVNHCALVYPDVDNKTEIFNETNRKKLIDNSLTLMQRVLLVHEKTELLEMLLQNGAKPNFYGAGDEKNKGLLYIAVSLQKEQKVKLLLENGADPNPDTAGTSSYEQKVNDKILASATAYSKSLRDAIKKKPMARFSNDDLPLLKAITTGNIEIIRLLLQFGASATKKDQNQFDALGYEACWEGHLPNFQIIELLVKYGANLNATQGTLESKNITTPLIFACQRDDIDTVKGLIELKANPNQEAPNWVSRGGQSYFEMVTVLSKAYFKGHEAIFNFLLEQQQAPISFTTKAMTMALSFKYQKNQYFDLQSLQLAVEITPMIKKLIAKLPQNDDEEQKVASFADEQGRFYFGIKLYEQALTYFYAYLLTNKMQNKQDAYYNVGSCHRYLGNKEMAIMFYKMCIKQDPTTANALNADKQLKRLLPNELESIGSPTARPF